MAVDQDNQEPNYTLYYDGECAFCRACARLVRKHDQKAAITLIPIQKSEHASNDACYESILFIKNAQQYKFSTAVVEVARTLGGMWAVLGWCLWLVPKPIRDFIYRFVAKHRHWFISNNSRHDQE